MQIVNTKSPEVMGCIILHPGFQNVCLNPWVLETAYYSYRQHYGANAVEGAINKFSQLCFKVYCLPAFVTACCLLLLLL